ncbi:MAG: hypothetical protein IJS67_04530, partial [Clostridia bacterium]|nr:hypothetical protein [Clostridia bacterium]
MKKLIILLLSVCIVSCLCLTACGGNEDATIVDQSATETATDHSESGQSDAVIILQYKTTAKNKLDEMVNPVVKVVSQEDLKSAIVNYYNSEKNYIEGIIDLDTAKEAAGKVVSDTKAFTLNTLKPLAIQKLNEVVNPLIENIAYDEIKNTVQSFYDTEMGKVAELETLSDVAGFYKVIFEDVKSLLVEETQKALVALKNKAIGELDAYLSALIE